MDYQEPIHHLRFKCLLLVDTIERTDHIKIRFLEEKKLKQKIYLHDTGNCCAGRTTNPLEAASG